VAFKRYFCLTEEVPFNYCLILLYDAKNLVLGRISLRRQTAWKDLRCGSTKEASLWEVRFRGKKQILESFASKERSQYRERSKSKECSKSKELSKSTDRSKSKERSKSNDRSKVNSATSLIGSKLILQHVK
jgi:hypothetical protein